MGLHYLCDQCQRLCRASLIPVNKQDVHEFSRFATRPNSSQYMFYDLSGPSIHHLPSLISSPSLKNTIQTIREQSSTSKEGLSSSILANHSVRHLREAIREGCHLCHLLFPQGTSEDEPEDGSGVHLLIGIPMLSVWGKGPMLDPNDYLNSHMSLRIEFFHGEDLDSSQVWEYPLLPCDLEVRLTVDLPRPIISSEDEMIHGFRKSTIEQTRAWIRNCRHHDLCNDKYFGGELSSPSQLPTRLLEVSLKSDVFQVRLVEPLSYNQEVPLSSSYATLSHCWGDRGVSMKLLSSNISAYRSIVPFRELPRTFREAVIFCYLLEIRYLWIDALCIIQDSKSDWEREATRMYSVYAGAVVNFAASVSSNCEGGLLVQSNLLTPCYVQTLWGSCEASSKFTIGFEEESCYRAIEWAALNERSWVFQERLLSARTVHFCKDQIWFQCRSASYAECFGTNYPVKLQQPSNIIIQDTKWDRLVEKYVETRLSHESDRLAALSGIAQSFMITHSLEPDDYVAGLWRSDLVNGLCWNVERAQLARNDIAPTWSWASTLSGSRIAWEHTYWPGYEDEIHSALRVIDVSLHSDPDTPFNHTRKGPLRIRGSISSVEVSKLDTTDYQSYYNIRRKDLCVDLNTPQKSFPFDERTLGKDEYQDTIYICSDEETFGIEGRTLHLLPMRRRGPLNDAIKRDKEPYDDYSYAAMLLKKVIGTRGTYQRIGWVNTRVPDKEVGYSSGDVPSWWSCGVHLENDDFLESHGNGVYSFEII